MVVMVVAKKKLALPLKKAATVVSPSTEATRAVAPATPTGPSKQPHPEVEKTGNIARIEKCIKKKAREEEREIHVISNQTTRTITPSASIHSHVVQVSAMVL